MFDAQTRRMKSDCWRSPWRAIVRDESGRPERFLLLTPAQMHEAAVTGRVPLAEPLARRLGLIPEVDVTS